MQVLILGSGAGGGVPQWNCHCQQCAGCRSQRLPVRPRTQSSIAVSNNGQDWVLINASPDIRQQINQSPLLWPADPNQQRGTGIRSIILTDSQIDHTTGLLTLREGLPLPVYCSDVVFEDLTESFPVFPMLSHWHGGLQRHPIAVEPTAAFHVDDVSGIRFEPVVLESNAPPYSKYRDNIVPGNNLGLAIIDEHSGGRLFYAPGCVQANEQVKAQLERAHGVLFDGTLWLDDEMIKNGFSQRLGTQMGHMPVNGPDGTVALLNQYDISRKILIHINNTNPVLDESSEANAYLRANDIELAYDGMHIHL